MRCVLTHPSAGHTDWLFRQRPRTPMDSVIKILHAGDESPLNLQVLHDPTPLQIAALRRTVAVGATIQLTQPQFRFGLVKGVVRLRGWEQWLVVSSSYALDENLVTLVLKKEQEETYP